MRLVLEDNEGGNPRRRRMRKPRGIGRRGRRGVRLLAPKGDGRQVAVYDPSTGMATVLNDGVPLSGLFKGLKQKRKAKKAFRKKKQAIKQEQKLQRYENRQTAKTARQSGRQDRKMTRIKGKQDVIRARYDKKVNKQTEREREFQTDAASPQYQEGSDQIPEQIYEDTPGGSYMNQDTDPQGEDVQYDEYEEVPEGEDYEEYEEAEYVDDPYGGAMEDNVPMNGWLDTVFKAGKSVVNKIAGTQAGQAVKQGVINKADYDRLKSEAALLRQKAEDLQKEKITYGIGGFIAGAAAGVLVTKMATRRRS